MHVLSPKPLTRPPLQLVLCTLLALLLAGPAPASAQWWKRIVGGGGDTSYGLRFVDPESNTPTTAPLARLRVGERHRVTVALYAVRTGELDASRQLATAPGGSVVVRVESSAPRVLAVEPAEAPIQEHYDRAVAEFWLVGKAPGTAKVTARAMLGTDATASTWFGPVQVDVARVAEPPRLEPKPKAAPQPEPEPEATVEPEPAPEPAPEEAVEPAAPAPEPVAPQPEAPVEQPEPITPAPKPEPVEAPESAAAPAPAAPPSEPVTPEPAPAPEPAVPESLPLPAERVAFSTEPAEAPVEQAPDDGALRNPTAVGAPPVGSARLPAPLRERAASPPTSVSPASAASAPASVPVEPLQEADPLAEQPAPAPAPPPAIPSFLSVVQPPAPEPPDELAERLPAGPTVESAVSAALDEDAGILAEDEIIVPPSEVPEDSPAQVESPAAAPGPARRTGPFAVDDLPVDLEAFETTGAAGTPKGTGAPPPCPRFARVELRNVLDRPVLVRVRESGAPAALVQQLEPAGILQVVPTQGAIVWIDAEKPDGERQGLRLAAANAPEDGRLTLPAFTAVPWLRIQVTQVDCVDRNAPS